MTAWLALLGALLAFGAGSLLQASGARRTPIGTGFVAATVAFLRSWQYSAGTVLDIAAVFLSGFALRALPLFLVQAASAASLVITALGSAVAFGERRRGSIPAIAAVVCGLTLAATSAAPGPSVAVDVRGSLLLAAGLPFLLLTRVAFDRVGVAPHIKHAVLAGLSYAGMAVSLRVLHVPSNPWLLVTEPAALAATGYLLIALFFFGRALRGGAVTVAMAIVVSFDTLLPAVIGLLWLGDATRPGWALAALIGLAMTSLGVVSLIRTLRADGIPAGDGIPPERRSAKGSATATAS